MAIFDLARRAGTVRVQPRSARSFGRESQRARAAIVSIALLGTALVASHPELFSDLFARAFRRDLAGGPQYPLATLVEKAEAASAAGNAKEVAHLCAAIVHGYPDHPVAEPAHVRMVQAYMARRAAPME